MGDDGGADIHLQPLEDPMPEQVETPEGGCDPMGSPCWSKLLVGPVAPWREEPMPEQVCWQDLSPRGGPTLEQSVPEGLHPVEGTYAGAVREELQPVGRTHVGEVHGGLSPVGGAPRWSRGRA
ncbi:EH domain-containing protein 4 [Grus japonensis]|uniref:EH domain-containing protein 4 n=1 Tax=Grus japonensis TaxID=30415 RepID=A0ABC9X2R5_GRUJA